MSEAALRLSEQMKSIENDINDVDAGVILLDMVYLCWQYDVKIVKVKNWI